MRDFYEFLARTEVLSPSVSSKFFLLIPQRVHYSRNDVGKFVGMRLRSFFLEITYVSNKLSGKQCGLIIYGTLFLPNKRRH